MISFMKGRLGQAPSRRPNGRVLSALVFAGLFSIACKDATGPEQLTTLTLTPATSTTTPTGTVQLKSAGTRTGQAVTNLVGQRYAVTAGGGTVNSAGLFTAPSTPGTSTVTVTCGGLTATATITVTAGPLATITVTPNPVTLAINTQQQFTAVGRDAFGNIVAITPVWSTTNPPGTINASTGLFTSGTTLGTYANSVKATSGTIFGTATVTVVAGALATITVTPNPDTLAIRASRTFTAVGRDAGGNVVPINPTWSVANGGGTIPAGTTGQTAVFTAGDVLGTYTNTVKATQGTISGSATVTVIAGPAATLVVTPEIATLAPGATQTFTAVAKDAGGNDVTNVSWSVVNGGGTISGATGRTVVFTAGSTAGTYTNTVRAAQGSLADSSTVIVTAPPPPPSPARAFRFIARTRFTCTRSSIVGSVATNQAPAPEAPPGSIIQTGCTITGTTEIGTAAAKQAYQDFLVAYAAAEATACGTTLTGTLAGRTLAPGVYCFDNAATLTGTLTLDGPSTGVWLFKIGQAGIPGALTGNSFDVVLAGGASACNVTWWVREASTMNISNFKGNILAGAGVTFTGGTYKGNASSKEDVTVTDAVATACDA